MRRARQSGAGVKGGRMETVVGVKQRDEREKGERGTGAPDEWDPLISDCGGKKGEASVGPAMSWAARGWARCAGWATHAG